MPNRERREAEDRSIVEALELSAARARGLAELAQTAAEKPLDYEETLRRAAHLSAELIGESCAISLVSEDKTQLTVGAFHHVDPSAIEALRSVMAHPSIPTAECIAGRVAVSGTPIFLPTVAEADLRAAAYPPHLAYLDRVKISSMMIVPLRDKSEPLGAIAMTRATPDDPYTPSDLAFLFDLAARASSAIANARMFARLQSEHAQRLRTEVELKGARDRLARGEHLQRLSVSVAHDFDSLLASIVPMATLCLSGRLSVPEQKDLGTLLTSVVESGTALTRQLIAFGQATPLQRHEPALAANVGEPLRPAFPSPLAKPARTKGEILHLQAFALRGGCETNCATFVRQTPEHAHRIIVLGEPGPMSKEWASLGAEVTHLRLLERGFLAFVSGLDAALRPLRPEGVVVWTGVRVPLVLCRLASLDCPVVLHAGNPYRRQDDVARWLTVAESFPVPARTTVLCCSEEVRRSHEEAPYFRGLRLEVAYNPVDVPARNGHVARPLSPKVPVRLGMVARLDPIKDHRTVLEAFAQLARDFPLATLHLAGDGSERAGLERRTRELGIASQVELLGSIRDVSGFLRSLDLFVYATTADEGLGNALVEALAHGLPCAVTDLPVTREVVGDGGAAALCPPRDPGALAATMRDLITNLAARQRMSEEAFARAVFRFDAKANSRRYLEALGFADRP